MCGTALAIAGLTSGAAGAPREVNMRRMSRAVVVGLLCGLALVGTGRGAGAAGAATVSADPAARVNLNSASAEELARLPGVGPAKAQAIIEHRKGEPFHKPDDLRKVKGIGDKLYDRVKDQITVGEPGAVPKGHGG
jgi:competence protein ComEA